MPHLSYEELERYLDEEDLTEEYLLWLEPVMKHLDSCIYCRKKMQRLMVIDELCEAENALALLEIEEEIRREVVAYKKMKKWQNSQERDV